MNPRSGNSSTASSSVRSSRAGCRSRRSPLSLEEGLLVVAVTTGPWAAQVKFMVEEIGRRANAAIGSEVVRQVQVVVRPDAVKPL
ncbi:MAG: DciA family protein [Actinomycetota bacterium]